MRLGKEERKMIQWALDKGFAVSRSDLVRAAVTEYCERRRGIDG